MKNMNRYLALVALIISLISCQSEDNPNRYELIPYPNDMEQMSGRFSFDDDTQIFISPECGDEVNEILAQFAEQFGKTAGKDLKIAEKEGKNMMIVRGLSAKHKQKENRNNRSYAQRCTLCATNR